MKTVFLGKRRRQLQKSLRVFGLAAGIGMTCGLAAGLTDEVARGANSSSRIDTDSFTFRASGDTPFKAGCSGTSDTGTLYANAEVEPFVAVNPRFPLNLVGVWQQDRWSNGGARGLGTGYSFDGGVTWKRVYPPFSVCAGGNAANNGNYERATDPWVTFSPNGVVHALPRHATVERIPGAQAARAAVGPAVLLPDADQVQRKPRVDRHEGFDLGVRVERSGIRRAAAARLERRFARCAEGE